jgi:hypothetical protein
MATYTLSAGQRGAYAKTLVASTVDTVDLDGSASTVEVVTDGTAAVYFTVDGTTPTVAGATTYEVPLTGGYTAREVHGHPQIDAVKLISAGTPKYSVTQL